MHSRLDGLIVFTLPIPLRGIQNSQRSDIQGMTTDTLRFCKPPLYRTKWGYIYVEEAGGREWYGALSDWGPFAEY